MVTRIARVSCQDVYRRTVANAGDAVRAAVMARATERSAEGYYVQLYDP